AGPQGPKGETGAAGPVGATGPQGPKGDPGETQIRFRLGPASIIETNSNGWFPGTDGALITGLTFLDPKDATQVQGLFQHLQVRFGDGPWQDVKGLDEVLNREFCHAVNISYCIQFIFHRNAGSSCSNGRQWRWRNYSRRADGPYHI
ncbi:TPA: phage tail fiber C-terminal domain-containing protein, partial [Escherichia coli]